MSLGFPTNPTIGTTYTLGTQTYIWTGVAWAIKTSAALYPQSITVGTGTSTIVINSGTITINNYQVVTTGTLNSLAVTALYAGTDTAVDSNIGVVTVWNTSTLQSVTDRGSTTTNAITITNSTQSTGTDSGALIISGGVGIGKNLNVGGIVTITDTTNSTSTQSGALIVAGGVAVEQDLYVGGNFYANGHSVLTTSSFLGQVVGATDILITATNAGVIYFNDVSTLQSVTSRGHTTDQQIIVTNTTTSQSSSTGAVVITGGLGVGGRIYAESVQIADAIFDSTVVYINNTATIVVDSYPFSTFRSAKYVIQIDSGSGPTAEFEVIELLLLVDNMGAIYATEYAVLTTGAVLGEFSAAFDAPSASINLYFTPSVTTNKVLTVLRTGLTA